PYIEIMSFRIIRTEKDIDFYYYAKEIEINRNRFKTPIVLKHKSIPNLNIQSIHRNEIYEIWKSFRVNEIQNVLSNATDSRNFINKISTEINSITRNQPKSYFLAIKNFQNNPLNFFSDQLIEFLIDSVYLHTDIISLPIIRRIEDFITNVNLRDQYITFIENCLQIANTLNNKPIMAVIPPLAPAYIPPLVEAYLNLDINIFCFDFSGSSLSTYYPLYFQLLRTIYRYDRGTFEEKVKYIINLKTPVNRNRYMPFPAEDMMTPALAVDLIGFNHLSGGSRPRTQSTVRSRTSRRRSSPSNTNLLNVDSYFYHRIANMNEFNNIFQNPLIQPMFNNFSTATLNERNDFRRKFNYFNMNTDLLQFHNRIINNNPIQNDLRNKSGIAYDLNSKTSVLDIYLNNTSITQFF
ncbi:MAG: hypothetical protein ACFFDN_13055, partial [Candidatus Hodarchaeota archaeon]